MTTASDIATSQAARRAWNPRWVVLPGEGTQRLGLLILCIAMVTYLGIEYPRYVSTGNIWAVLLNASPMLLAAIGTGYLLIGGNVDLSIGAQWALDGMVVADVAQSTQSTVAAIAAGLALGLGIGIFNGILVRSLAISPLIVTLGMNLVYGGFAFVVSSGNPIEGLPNSFVNLGQGHWRGVPIPVVVSLVVFLLGSVYLLVSVVGLRIYALGGNAEAARSAGVQTGRLTVGLFAWNGLVIALVAILQTAQLGEGAPQVGVNFSLNVLTAVILGGVSFMGGVGRPLGILLGVLTLEILNSGLIFMGVDDWWQQIAAGFVLVLALVGDEFIRRRKIRTGHAIESRLLASVANHFRSNKDAAAVGTAHVADDVDTSNGRHDGAVATAPGKTLLSVESVGRTFGQLTAVDEVSFEVREGEVLCLVGDNGAGKSTLVKMISGLVVPTRGAIKYNAQTLPTGQPGAIRTLGIETVYQDLALCGNLSVFHNLVLGEEPKLGGVGRLLGLRNDRTSERWARERLLYVGVSLPNLYAVVRSLSGGQRQAVALARAVKDHTRLLVLDEPTAALAVTQTERVLALVRRIAASGKGIIFISHDIGDVLAVADTVLVIRHGRVVFNGPSSELDESRLVHLIAGITEQGAATRSRTTRAGSTSG